MEKMDPMGFGYQTTAVDAILNHRYGALPPRRSNIKALSGRDGLQMPRSESMKTDYGGGATSLMLAHRYG